MVHHYFFFNLLTYTLNILILGTGLSYLIFFFIYKNQTQNIIKSDTIYNLIKLVLLLTLGISFIFFIWFMFYFYTYYSSIHNYSIFSNYTISPKFLFNFFLISFELSVDFFGVLLLLLAYFIGILSLMALDNRLF